MADQFLQYLRDYMVEALTATDEPPNFSATKDKATEYHIKFDTLAIKFTLKVYMKQSFHHFLRLIMIH